jgi:hypothetical protein
MKTQAKRLVKLYVGTSSNDGFRLDHAIRHVVPISLGYSYPTLCGVKAGLEVGLFEGATEKCPACQRIASGQ